MHFKILITLLLNCLYQPVNTSKSPFVYTLIIFCDLNNLSKNISAQTHLNVSKAPPGGESEYWSPAVYRHGHQHSTT